MWLVLNWEIIQFFGATKMSWQLRRDIYGFVYSKANSLAARSAYVHVTSLNVFGSLSFLSQLSLFCKNRNLLWMQIFCPNKIYQCFLSGNENKSTVVFYKAALLVVLDILYFAFVNFLSFMNWIQLNPCFVLKPLPILIVLRHGIWDPGRTSQSSMDWLLIHAK